MSLTGLFTDIANAIRNKKGTTDSIPATSFASEIESIETGGGSGGGSTSGDYHVLVIDYDGTVLDEQWLNNGDFYQAPNPPSHSGLVFQGHVSNVVMSNGGVTIADNDVIISFAYTTSSGLNEFDIELTPATGLTITLNTSGTKDWGDGTSDALTSHTYAEYGKYTIKDDSTSMSTSSSAGVMGNSSSGEYCLTGVRIIKMSSIPAYAFQHCWSLQSVILSNAVTELGDFAFSYTYNLKHITLPMISYIKKQCFYYSDLRSIAMDYRLSTMDTKVFESSKLTYVALPYLTRIENSTFKSTRLKRLVIPSTVQTIFSEAFSLCRVEEVIFNEGLTKIDEKGFYQTSGLKKANLPTTLQTLSSFAFSLTNLEELKFYNLTNISYQAFYNARCILKYDFTQQTSIPSLGNSSAFDATNKLYKIYVPDSLYDSWKATSNWSDIADHIYKASEMED